MKTLNELRAVQPAWVTIWPSGVFSAVTKDKPPTLDFMQGVVGGYIEYVQTRGIANLQFWVNEEGKLKGMPFNKMATELLYNVSPEWSGRDVLVGTVFILVGRKVQAT